MDEATVKACFIMDKDMHAELKSICAYSHCSMKKYVLKAIAEKMLKEEAGSTEPGVNHKLDKSNSSSLLGS
jgi:hypothetical protein